MFCKPIYRWLNYLGYLADLFQYALFLPDKPSRYQLLI